MLGLWKARRGRRTAVATIAPFVNATRRRLGGIPDSAWREPYLIGFLGALITLLATQETGSLDADALASAQSGGWQEITGLPGALIGEDICFLSVSGDARFLEGCREAEAFFQALGHAKDRRQASLGASLDTSMTPEWVEGAPESALWSRFFDAHIG